MKYNRVIFAGGSGTIREPMAEGIMKKLMPGLECEARGLVVLFPEPINQKVEAVLASHDIGLNTFESKPLVEEDFVAGTLVVAMDKKDYNKILDRFEASAQENVALLSEYVEDELDILNPYGQSIQVYGLCYETLLNTLTKLREKIQEGYHE